MLGTGGSTVCSPPPAAARRARCRASAASRAAPPAPASTPALSNLLRWAATAGVAHASLAPAVFEHDLRGLAATANLPPGASVARVPHAAVLEVTTSPGTPPPGVPAPLFASFSWWARLALLLLYERSQGAASRLHSYISALPTPGDLAAVPLLWRNDEPALQQLSAALRARVDAQRAEVAAVVKALEAGGAPAWCRDAGDLRWAIAISRSRTFSGPYEGSDAGERKAQVALVTALCVAFVASGGAMDRAAAAGLACLSFVIIKDLITSSLPAGPRRYTLVPVVDLANHSSSAISDLAYSYFSDCFELTLGAGVGAGEQAFVSYGPLDSESLALFYGFVEGGEENSREESVRPSADGGSGRASGFGGARARQGMASGASEGAVNPHDVVRLPDGATVCVDGTLLDADGKAVTGAAARAQAAERLEAMLLASPPPPQQQRAPADAPARLARDVAAAARRAQRAALAALRGGAQPADDAGAQPGAATSG